MIVGTVFDGDDDNDTKWIQHDVYNDALRIIVTGCQRHYERATTLLNVKDTLFDNFLAKEFLDHRNIQNAHDLMAAAWRYKTRRAHPELPFKDKERVQQEIVIEWLDWLYHEINSWMMDDPYLIHTLITCLVYGNSETGYQAEDALALALKKRYRAIYTGSCVIPGR